MKVSYQYLDTLSQTVTAGAAPVLISNSVGYSRHKGIATLGYDRGGFSGQIQMNYIGKARIDTNSPADLYDPTTVSPFTYFNLSLSQDVAHRFTFHIDVDNIFNAGPPSQYPASGGAVPYFEGILGRYIRVGAGVHFCSAGRGVGAGSVALPALSFGPLLRMIRREGVLGQT